jgi:hypothetical protein
MADMIHYIAVFSLPDGEHVMHGWTQDIPTARKHVDGNILGRRRAMFPDEEAKLLTIRQVAPHLVDAEVKKEEDRIRAANPDRVGAEEQFAHPNQILEQRVTPAPEE